MPAESAVRRHLPFRCQKHSVKPDLPCDRTEKRPRTKTQQTQSNRHEEDSFIRGRNAEELVTVQSLRRGVKRFFSEHWPLFPALGGELTSGPLRQYGPETG